MIQAVCLEVEVTLVFADQVVDPAPDGQADARVGIDVRLDRIVEAVVGKGKKGGKAK